MFTFLLGAAFGYGCGLWHNELRDWAIALLAYAQNWWGAKK